MKSNRWLIAALGCLLICLWQYCLSLKKHDASYRMSASSGLYDECFSEAFYFYEKLGLFPLTTGVRPLEESSAFAQDLFKNSPERFRTEKGLCFRSGELAKLFLYYPSYWLTGKAVGAQVRTANIILFCFALCLSWIVGVGVGQTGIAFLWVLLMGSNPFQLYEVYGNENVFSWPISVLLLLLALHFPLFIQRRMGRWEFWLLPLLSGLILGFARGIRTEAALGLISLIYLYGWVCRWRGRERVLSLFLLLVSFWGAAQTLTSHLDGVYQRTNQVLAKAGGVPYEGPRRQYHGIWHTVWCGLGDFDDSKGHVWDDLYAYRRGDVLLKAKGLQFHYDGNFWMRESYDGKGLYPKKFGDFDVYFDAMRSSVLGDIRRDPLWFLGILLQRVHRALTAVTPLSIQVPWGGVTLSPSGYFLLSLGLLAFLWGILPSAFLSTLLFTIPLNLLGILVYSGGGMTYYGIYHLVCGVGVLWGVIAFARGKKVLTPLFTASKIAIGLGAVGIAVLGFWLISPKPRWLARYYDERGVLQNADSLPVIREERSGLSPLRMGVAKRVVMESCLKITHPLTLQIEMDATANASLSVDGDKVIDIAGKEPVWVHRKATSRELLPGNHLLRLSSPLLERDSILRLRLGEGGDFPSPFYSSLKLPTGEGCSETL